jgi:hypothetical protein
VSPPLVRAESVIALDRNSVHYAAYEDSVNLTKQQMDLLRLLVEKDESTGGTEFIFVQSQGGRAVCYPGGVSVNIPYDESDFRQLQSEGLINLIPIASNQFRGKPTAHGIALARNGIAGSNEAPLVQAEGSQGAGGMPALSVSTTRKLAVLWDALRDNHKLMDEEVSGYDLGRQWLMGAIAKPPVGMNLGGLNIGPDHKRSASWLGLDPTVRVAEGQFRGIDREYWSRWCSSGLEYQVYGEWLDSVMRQISAELESIWKGRSDASDRWFEGTCRPAIKKALTTLVRERIAQARDVELRRCDGYDRRGAPDLKASDLLPKPAGVSQVGTASLDPPPATESARTVPATLADSETKARRYAILKQWRAEKGLGTMGDLARHAGASVSAIQGMVRGDRSRYAEAKLEGFLKLIGVSRNNW